MDDLVTNLLWCAGFLLAGYGVGGVWGYEWVKDVQDLIEKARKWKERLGK